MLLLTAHGSHMCFFEGTFWPRRGANRAEAVALEYFRALELFWRRHPEEKPRVARAY